MTKSIADQSFWNKKNVLVTGHTGFKGTWLSLWLKSMGAYVTGIGLEPEHSSIFQMVDLERSINNKFVDITNFDLLSKTLKAINPEIVIKVLEIHG